jgi:hypothetical protein
MADSIGEYILLNYFFPDVKDRKKQNKAKQEFLTDMKFNLAKGTIQKASGKIGQKRNLVRHLGCNFVI